MKTFLTRLIAIAVCLSGLAWAPVGDRKTDLAPMKVETGKDLVAAFSPVHAEALPQSFAKAKVKDLLVTEKVIQFSINKFFFQVEWIGQKSRWIRINHRYFSQSECLQEKDFRKAFFAKFGIFKRTRHSYNSLVFSRAFAAIDDDIFSESTAATTEVDEEEVEQGDEHTTTFEGQNKNQDFANYVLKDDKLHTNNSMLSKTRAGQRLQTVSDLTTGDSLFAMAKYVMMFQGSIGCAMGNACVPGLGLMNNVGKDPLSVPMPFGRL